ncbi:hypothetical protein AB0G02_30680 [Actinosynnema sp. NPDC023658]|uniref:hypothetical protein n=1 Tax=Actinosynnema sp. NPDC023658 TaxID=3155465 RepID=UPI0033E0AE2E
MSLTPIYDDLLREFEGIIVVSQAAEAVQSAANPAPAQADEPAQDAATRTDPARNGTLPVESARNAADPVEPVVEPAPIAPAQIKPAQVAAVQPKPAPAVPPRTETPVAS